MVVLEHRNSVTEVKMADRNFLMVSKVVAGKSEMEYRNLLTELQTILHTIVCRIHHHLVVALELRSCWKAGWEDRKYLVVG